VFGPRLWRKNTKKKHTQALFFYSFGMSWLNIFGQKKEAVPPPAPGGGARRAAGGDPQEKLRRVQNDREARTADVESIQTKINYETGQYKKAMANNDQASEWPGIFESGWKGELADLNS
jgi:hypothetical protein